MSQSTDLKLGTDIRWDVLVSHIGRSINVPHPITPEKPEISTSLMRLHSLEKGLTLT